MSWLCLLRICSQIIMEWLSAVFKPSSRFEATVSTPEYECLYHEATVAGSHSQIRNSDPYF
jgi:hypothetical protein